MDIKRARMCCMSLESIAERTRMMQGTLKFNDVYVSENDMIEDLKKVVIPANGVPANGLYKGYEYVHSFAKQVQNGIKLSDAQMRQAKRIAIEIKKAAAIADCY